MTVLNATAVKLGASGPEVFPVGLGCMAMSGMYGAADEREGERAIRAAIERGVTLLDTGDFYGAGHNERLVGRAIQGLRDRVQLSVKFGAFRTPGGGWGGVYDGRPAAVKNFLAYSLDRLGVEYVDVYRPSRLDPAVAIEDTVGAIADMVRAGYVRHIGLSEMSAETVRKAHRVHPIADLQIEYSVGSRGAAAGIFPTLRELGVSATLYGVFSRGLLTGSKPKGGGDFRAHLPRFVGEDGARNEAVASAVRALAKETQRTPSQLLLGWVLATQPGFVPLVGARTVAQVEDALGVVERPLHEDEVQALGAITERLAGDRYGAAHMAQLDSER